MYCLSYWAGGSTTIEIFSIKMVFELLYNNRFIRYGVPKENVSNIRGQFTSKLVGDLMNLYKIKHHKTTLTIIKPMGRWK